MLADPVLDEASALAGEPRTTAAPLQVAPAAILLWQLHAHAGLCEATAVRALGNAGLRVVQRRWAPAVCAGGSPVLLLLTAPASAASVRAAHLRLLAKTGAEVQCSACPPGLCGGDGSVR